MKLIGTALLLLSAGIGVCSCATENVWMSFSAILLFLLSCAVFQLDAMEVIEEEWEEEEE